MPTSRPLDDAALDRWLHARLRERHEAVLREPIPDSLLRLLTDDPNSPLPFSGRERHPQRLT